MKRWTIQRGKSRQSGREQVCSVGGCRGRAVSQATSGTLGKQLYLLSRCAHMGSTEMTNGQNVTAGVNCVL